MGKREKPLGVKRKRGKKFEYEPKPSLDLKRSVKTKSVFKDKRLGEKNPNLSLEDKYLLRFQRERELQSRRSQKFELDDDIQLTHKGVRLADLQDDYVEDYDIDVSDDEPQKHAKLSDEVVETAHFGDEKVKTKKDAYEELIQKSKENKAKRQQEKEENLDITRKLDKEFEDISRRLKFKEKKNEEKDEFDELINEIRDDSKMAAEGGADLSLKELRREMEENGENWDVPEGFKEFVVKAREHPLKCVKYMKNWTDCEVRRLKTEKQERLLLFALRYFLEEMDEGEIEEFSEMVKVLYRLCKDYQRPAEKYFGVICENLPEKVNLSLSFFYHLVYLLFPIEFKEKLTVNLAYFAGELFVSCPLNSLNVIRNLLFLCKVFADKWMDNWFCPEVCRFLLRLYPSLTEEVEAGLAKYFKEGVRVYANGIISELSQKFGESLSFPSIFNETPFSDFQEARKEPLQLYHRPAEEIETFEPVIFSSIKSNKKNKDLNKEITELDRLREQQKRAKKLAKKALEKETEVEMYDKGLEFDARVKVQERKQGLVKNMLDELQAEYKRFDTTLEKKKEKKKRKERMGGNRTEQNKRDKNFKGKSKF